MLAPLIGAELCGTHGVGKWSESWDAETRQLANGNDQEAMRDALSGLLEQTTPETVTV